MAKKEKSQIRASGDFSLLEEVKARKKSDLRIELPKNDAKDCEKFETTSDQSPFKIDGRSTSLLDYKPKFLDKLEVTSTKVTSFLDEPLPILAPAPYQQEPDYSWKKRRLK